MTTEENSIQNQILDNLVDTKIKNRRRMFYFSWLSLLLFIGYAYFTSKLIHNGKSVITKTDTLIIRDTVLKDTAIYKIDTFTKTTTKVIFDQEKILELNRVIDSLKIQCNIYIARSDANQQLFNTCYNNSKKLSIEYKIFRDSTFNDCEKSKQYIYESINDLKKEIARLRLQLDSCNTTRRPRNKKNLFVHPFDNFK